MLKPLLFVLSPSDIRCSGRMDTAVAAAGVLTLMVLSAWAMVPKLIVPGSEPATGMLALAMALHAAALAAGLGARWGVATAVAWRIGTALAGRRGPALSYLSVIVMADTVVAVQSALTSAILWIRSSAPTPALEAPPLGLDMFVQSSSPVVRVLLASASGFMVWHSLVLAIGLRHAVGLSWRVAVAVTMALVTLDIAARMILAALIA